MRLQRLQSGVEVTVAWHSDRALAVLSRSCGQGGVAAIVRRMQTVCISEGIDMASDGELQIKDPFEVACRPINCVSS